MKDLPTVEPKWTDMSFSLTVIEAYNVLRQLSLSASSNMSHPNEMAWQQAYETLRARFEIEYSQHRDQNIPIQRMAYLIGKLIPSKFDFVTRQIWLRHHASKLATTPSSLRTNKACQGTERDLLDACKTLGISNHFQVLARTGRGCWHILALQMDSLMRQARIGRS